MSQPKVLSESRVLGFPWVRFLPPANGCNGLLDARVNSNQQTAEYVDSLPVQSTLNRVCYRPDGKSGEGDDDESIGIVALFPEAPGAIWMGRHQIAYRLAQHAHVCWVPPPSKGYLCGTADSQLKTTFVPQCDGVSLVKLGLMRRYLFYPSFLAHQVNQRILDPVVHHLRHEVGCKKIFLYLTRPSQAWALDTKGIDGSCYHVFDEYSFSDQEQPLDRREIDLIRRVTFPVFASEALFERKAAQNQHSILLENGVDLRAFDSVTDIPQDLAEIPSPRIGYCGVVKRQLNLQLLFDLATNNPQYSFPIVGPIGNVSGEEAILESLKGLPNVFFLGGKPVESLPSYMANFDVGLLIYKDNDYTKYISPLKLKEYLASKIPIVSTPIRPILKYQQYVHLARSPAEWEHAIKSSLDVRSPESHRNLLEGMDWSDITARLFDTMKKFA